MGVTVPLAAETSMDVHPQGEAESPIAGRFAPAANTAL